ncbi:MAG: D-alanine--D-alanine ligase [Candidatus Limnocylindrales bacterium]
MSAARARPAGAGLDRSHGARPPVVVLLGGPSAEHDVSVVSGRAIASALAAGGSEVEARFIGLDGRWWQLPDGLLQQELTGTDLDDPAALGATGPLSAAGALETLAARDPRPIVWIALHGPFGEDGTVQALCESVGLIYTGSGVAASALGMDKVLFKRLARALEMPVVPFEVLSRAEHLADPTAAARRLEAFANRLPDPRLMVKPARLGSSIGMSVVHRPDEPPELEFAIDGAFAYDDLLLAEAYLAGARELEVAVVGEGADCQAFGPGEVFPGHEFYDYAAKYEAGVSRTTDQPDLGAGPRDRLLELARAAFVAIGGSGFARVDFLMHGGRIYLSEINTIPGFTPISLFPILCRQGGYDFGGICQRIVGLAVERAARRPDRVLHRADLP